MPGRAGQLFRQRRADAVRHVPTPRRARSATTSSCSATASEPASSRPAIASPRLRRPGAEGIPFHMLRVDIAGNMSKRFSASGLRIPRFSGACPRWNVFGAFLTPGMIRTQLSQMPDGQIFFGVARTVPQGRRRLQRAAPALRDLDGLRRRRRRRDGLRRRPRPRPAATPSSRSDRRAGSASGWTASSARIRRCTTRSRSTRTAAASRSTRRRSGDARCQ